MIRSKQFIRHAQTREIVQRTIVDALSWSGKTQKKVADGAGLSESYLSCLVHGKRTPTMETLADILAVCGRRLRDTLSLPNRGG